MADQKFDNQKQDLPWEMKRFPNDNTIPGASAGLNTPPSPTPSIGGWTNYQPPGATPQVSPPPDSKGAMAVMGERKQEGLIDSGDNFSPFVAFPDYMEMDPGASSQPARGGIYDSKQGNQHPFGKSFPEPTQPSGDGNTNSGGVSGSGRGGTGMKGDY